MKVNKTHLSLFILVILLSIFGGSLLFSCSDAKIVQRNLARAEKHGGKIVCDTTFVDVPRIVKGKDGRDSLIYVPTSIPCPPCQPCDEKETRFEIRWKYKFDLKKQKARDAFLIDSLSKLYNKEIKIAKIEGKKAGRLEKQETKQKTANNKSWNITMIVVGILALIFLFLLIYSKIKSKWAKLVQ